jgi:hypothetical protein
MALIRGWNEQDQLIFEVDSYHECRGMVVSAPISQVSLHATLPVSKAYNVLTGSRFKPVQEADINTHIGYLSWPMVVYEKHTTVTANDKLRSKVLHFSMTDAVMHVSVEYMPSPPQTRRPWELVFRRAIIDMDFEVLSTASMCSRDDNHMMFPTSWMVMKELQLFSMELELLRKLRAMVELVLDKKASPKDAGAVLGLVKPVAEEITSLRLSIKEAARY